MSRFDLKKIASLARLSVSGKDLKTFESQVESILQFVEQLKEIDVEGVEPTSHPLSLQNVYRTDDVAPSLDVTEFFKQAPGTRGSFFEVPKVIEDKS